MSQLSLWGCSPGPGGYPDFASECGGQGVSAAVADFSRGLAELVVGFAEAFLGQLQSPGGEVGGGGCPTSWVSS